jgi:hypothetical protein
MNRYRRYWSREEDVLYDLDAAEADELIERNAERQRDAERQRPVVRKIYESPPMQQNRMDSTTDADWQRWADGKIAAALERYDEEMTEAIGEALGEIRKRLRTEFAAELGQLRADVEVLRGIVKGEIASIKDKGKADAA